MNTYVLINSFFCLHLYLIRGSFYDVYMYSFTTPTLAVWMKIAESLPLNSFLSVLFLSKALKVISCSLFVNISTLKRRQTLSKEIQNKKEKNVTHPC